MKRLSILLLCFLPTLSYAQNRAFGAYEWACAELHAYFSERWAGFAEKSDAEEVSEREWIQVEEDDNCLLFPDYLEFDEDGSDDRG